MSDATDLDAALEQLAILAQADAAPTLTVPELESILLKYKRASTWVAATAYAVGAVIVPTVRTGHRYKAIVGGTSGTVEPYTGSNRWPTNEGAKITDGTSSPQLTWQEDGLEYANIYDVRGAAHECWDLKAKKASQFIDSGDLAFNQVYMHCQIERDRLAPVLIA